MRKTVQRMVLALVTLSTLFSSSACLPAGSAAVVTPTTERAEPLAVVATPTPPPTAPPATSTATSLNPSPSALAASPASVSPAAPAPAAASGAPTALVGLPSVAMVADRVRPAVVFISVQAVTAGEFFQPVPTSGVGSGVIFDPRGYILTNNHVVEGARTIQVVLPSGPPSHPARLVGRDPLTDLAIIKIEGRNLPVAPLGDSDRLRIGDWVIAIGNALGLEGGPTVTVGVVSALGRSIEEPNGAVLENLIQTDAAINPGNSGGPLINLAGEVVGINTAAPGPTRTGFQPSGIGFAISINSARPIIDDLLQHGRVRRPWLGVSIVTLTPSLAAQLGLGIDEGVLIGRIARNGPAAQAGLQPGDVLVALEGQKLRNTRDLTAALQRQKIGDRVTVTLVRDNRARQATVTLTEMPAP
ncbi:MAG: trypsin-like peptidase domain-containing protein [Chloroflexi bacterium]|nr:trypsin-like peptidase domain-containing protein [Chloroflexota bacterium]